MTNVALLSRAERDELEADKEACRLLCYRRKVGDWRWWANEQIEKQPPEAQALIKAALNRRMGKSK